MPLAANSRLRFFCEICHKQLRDENGYHCHLNSTSHQKQLQQFLQNPTEHLEKNSKMYIEHLTSLLRERGQQEDLAKLVDTIAEERRAVRRLKQTKWETVAQLSESLGESNNIIVRSQALTPSQITQANAPKVKAYNGDSLGQRQGYGYSYAPSGPKDVILPGGPKVVQVTHRYFVRYTISKTDLFQRQQKEQQHLLTKQKQVLAAVRIAQKREDRQKAERQRQQQRWKQYQIELAKIDETKIVDRLEINALGFEGKRSAKYAFQDDPIEDIEEYTAVAPRKCVNIESIYNSISTDSQKINSTDKQAADEEPCWLVPNIIVKILPHDIPDEFHNLKVPIEAVPQPYLAQIKIGQATLKIDQTYLQTVCPKTGNKVIIVSGPNKGKTGVLKEVRVEQGTANIQIDKIGSKTMGFNQFSKIGTQIKD